jgi:restriction system protein
MDDKSAPIIPTYDRLMWPALRSLKALGGSASNDELLSKLIELESIPENVASEMHADGRCSELEYRLAWAKSYLKRVDAIDNSARGVWAITETGERMTEAEVGRIPAIVRKQYSERRRTKAEQVREEAVVLEGEEIEVEERWKDELLAAMQRLTPEAFEAWPSAFCVSPDSSRLR